MNMENPFANNVIYKYPLNLADNQVVVLPEGSEILSVVNQKDQLVLYAHVDNEAQYIETATIYIYGTGKSAHVPEDAKFLGTVAQFGGELMWHVFYKKGGAFQ